MHLVGNENFNYKVLKLTTNNNEPQDDFSQWIVLCRIHFYSILQLFLTLAHFGKKKKNEKGTLCCFVHMIITIILVNIYE